MDHLRAYAEALEAELSQAVSLGVRPEPAAVHIVPQRVSSAPGILISWGMYSDD